VLQKALHRFAEAYFLCQVQLRKKLEGALVESLGRERCLLYVDTSRYDETPMKTTLRGDAAAGSASNVNLHALVPLPFGRALRLMHALAAHERSAAMVTKLMQINQAVWLLVNVGDIPVRLYLNTVCPLQPMESTAAPVCKKAVLRSCAVSTYSDGFKQRMRFCCSDSAKPNIVVENSIASDRHGWESLHLFCEVHVTAGIHSKTFEGLMPRTISSVIHASLSLQLSGYLNHFRKCLRHVIKSRIKLVPEGLPDDAVKYKRSVIKMFFSRLALTGRNRDYVEVCVPHGLVTDIDVAAVASVIENGLSFALVSAKPSVWPRHRWTGSEIAIDFWGRLEAMHGLASATYPLFSRTLGKELPPADPIGGAVGADGAAGVLDDGGVDDVAHVHHGPDAEVPADAAPADRHEVVDNTGRADSEPSFAEKNAKDRKLTLEWLSRDPLPDLMLLRCALNPIVRMLHDQLDMASLRWELSQRAAVARSHQMGRLPGLGARDYRIVTACELILEENFFKELQAIWLGPHHWRSFPERCYTEEFNCLAFRLLAREGALVEQLHVSNHSLFHFRVFGLLVDSSRAQSLNRTPDCMKGPWGKDLCARFPDLVGQDLWEVLLTLAMLIQVDITCVEAKHAAVRRQLEQRSTHTHTLNIEDASAEWLMQQARTLQRTRPWSGQHRHETSASEQDRDARIG
ncbi:unnamed protein product, partial [Prorocentrum cordatum]